MMKLTGIVTITERDVSGRVLRKSRQKNLITLVGRNLVRDFLDGPAPTAPTHIAVGTGTTAPAAANTALGTEVFRDTITTTTTGDGIITFTLSIGTASANGNTLTEAGVFNASSGGSMYARTTFTGVVKDNTKSVQIDWEITIADS